ncbi:hypothetical protein I7I50_09681 [Histoplasma capsulatum G186AR]|uniref:Uncharacterized protein n=1 Tax=Ajellomyces capsulatus TaxID=5037 RepID=A0A8H8D1J8_AJECA|nr:hypothetical protein I7I52_07211 [Histoplasma capsulatum]QSS74476.1 hypothetical protein I7I50_09681 [Histoplasma capsulatum G186AR]
MKSIQSDNAAALWHKISTVYMMSLEKERINILKELTHLHVKNSDYLIENYLHDFFIISL